MVVLQTFIKTAAVSGIAFFWVNVTVESLEMAWHIISSSLETWKPVLKEVMCESCHGYFLDDGVEFIHTCESCSDDLVRDQLKNNFSIISTCLTTSLLKQSWMPQL